MQMDHGFRAAAASDTDLLRRALLLNANQVTHEVSAQDVEDRHEYRLYYDGFPDDYEFGVVAELDGTPIGVVWARYSSENDPAAGYVADDVPEITICVFEGQRGRGLGHELLEEIEKEALRRGARALSLWVQDGNRSRRLYERFGFVGVEGVYDAGTMLKRL